MNKGKIPSISRRAFCFRVLLLLYSRLVLENKALASRIVTRRGVAFVIRGVAGSGHREELSGRELCFVPMSEGNSCFLLRWGRFIMITKVLKPRTPVPINILEGCQKCVTYRRRRYAGYRSTDYMPHWV